MEHKLRQAYQEMPVPQTNFEELAHKAQSTSKKASMKRMPALIAAVLIMMLCGAGWQLVSSHYGMWLLNRSTNWSDVQRGAEKYDLILLETLNGAPFYSYCTYSLVPNEVPQSVAITNPRYIPHCVTYGVEGTVDEDGYTDTVVNELELSFGTTENELWRYYFEHDADGKWTAWESNYSTMEYNGCVLQLGITSIYVETRGETIYSYGVHWVDERLNLVFSLCESETRDFSRVVECAKQIIDLNR